MRIKINENALGSFCYVIRMAYRYDKPYLFVMLSLMTVNIFIPFPMIVFPKTILDSLFLANDFPAALCNTAYMAAGFAALHTAEIYLRTQKEKLQFAFKQRFLKRLSEKAMSMPYAALENPTTTETINRALSAVNGDVNWAVSRGLSGDKGLDAVLSEFINISSGVFRLAGVTYILSDLNIGMFAVIFVILAINTVAGLVQKRSDYDRRTGTSKLNDRAHYFRKTMFDIAYAKEIRQANMQNYLTDMFVKCRNELIAIRYAKLSGAVLAGLLSDITGAAQEFAVLLYLIGRTAAGYLSIGGFTMYVAAINVFTNALIDLINSFLNLNLYSRFMSDYVRVINMPDGEYGGEYGDGATYATRPENNRRVAQPSNGARILPEVPQRIEFRNVWFRYPGSGENEDEYVLKNVSITIESGERLSVVGANGAGKSTFIKLILRLYTPQRGNIYLNGVDVNEIETGEYLRAVSAVFQDYVVYPFSIRDNIAFGEAAATDAFESCVRQTGIDVLASRLPRGVDTALSKMFDTAGTELSIGQQQRVMLARALYKNSGVVILDEPTAALDAMAEQELYRDFNSIMERKTIIYISHRLASARFCDRIAVFDKGVIREYGTHDSLMRENGLYNSMFTTQAKLYAEGEGEVSRY